MKRKFAIAAVLGLLAVLAAACVLSINQGGKQSSPPIPLSLTFEGEYSLDGGAWTPLEDGAVPSALDGDLVLRGHFSHDIFENSRINYYQNHLAAAMYVNGQLVSMNASMQVGLRPFLCGKGWDYWFSTGISTSDDVEIHLSNPHAAGNASAYADLLGTLYVTGNDDDALASALSPYLPPTRWAGGAAIILAVVLLGATIMSAMRRYEMTVTLCVLCALCLFGGWYVLSDDPLVNAYSDALALNTYSRCLSAMFFALSVGCLTWVKTSGPARRAAGTLFFVAAAFDAVLLALVLAQKTVLYDAFVLWTIPQALLCLGFLGCCVRELWDGRERDQIYVVSCLALLVTMLLDLAGVGRNAFTTGTCTKIAFAIIAVVHVTMAARYAVLNHQAVGRAKQLERELEDSRIAVMMSQMSPHFLNNVLNTIYHLCGRDPQTAQHAVSTFSDYLRNKLESLDKSDPVPFEEELGHIQTYLELEKIRFGDELALVYDVRCVEFAVPVLTVQPLVENAVKHGVAKRRGGGTVTIATRELDDRFEVQVSDDGVGFDVDAEPAQDGRSHVGIRNVRRRLQCLVDGSLDIASTPGTGTVATVAIPK